MGNQFTEGLRRGPPPKTNTIVINRAGLGDASAKAELIECYWGTIYLKFYELMSINAGRLIQDRDKNERAKDLTQGFFEAFLEGKSYLQLDKFDAKKGRFRNLLKQAVTFYFKDSIKRDDRLKKKFDDKNIPPFVSMDEILELSEKIDKSVSDGESSVDEQWAKDALRDLISAYFGRCAEKGEKDKGEILYYFLETKDFEAVGKRMHLEKARDAVKKVLNEFRAFVESEFIDAEDRELIYKLL